MWFANHFHPLSKPTLRRFAGLPLRHRLYVRIRWALAPIAEVVGQLPESGLCVDMGCGAGLVSHAASIARPGLKVIGIDLDGRRIALARDAQPPGGGNLEFREGSWFELEASPVDAFVFVDVLHHLGEEMQRDVLAFCSSRLRPGGRIVVKEVGLRPRWKYWYNAIFDRLTGTLGITRGELCTYRPPSEWSELGRRNGLHGTQLPLRHRDMAPHFLVVLEAPSG
jgi:SAM-dependent methyltransferase